MSARLERLKTRRIDASVPQAKLLNEVYKRVAQSASVQYVVGAMQPIDPDYTTSTYSEGERICNQLKKRLTTSCEYEYQGSVTNNTHIKARSDIDILVLTEKFYTLEQPQIPPIPYQGDPIQELVELRRDAVQALRSAFPQAQVDDSGSKSIILSGGSLRRKIDVVPANWFDTNDYARTKEKIHRAVQILNFKDRLRLKNTPFLHNAWIDHKDGLTSGGLRKAARLLKSVMYDSDSIELSSYDLVSIAFNIPDGSLNVAKGMELVLLDVCHAYCLELQRDGDKRATIDVPDKHRKVFAAGHATLQGLNQLCAALSALVTDVLNENQRSFKKLAEARVDY